MAWDIKSKARDPVQILSEATDSVTSLAVSGFEIATGSLDGKVRRYDLRKGELNVDDVKSSVGNICFTKDGQCVLTNCHNSCVKLIDKDSGEILAEFKGHENRKYRIDGCLFDNDSYVLSGSEDGNVYMWSLVEGALEGKLPHPGHKVVHSLSSHHKKKELLTAAEGFVYLWEESEEDNAAGVEESD
jgi:mitogen-activated protein kinase organizer 1